MSRPSAPRTLVLHALRLKGFADTDVVAAHAGRPADEAQALLQALLQEGLVAYREGRVSGWSLTPDGRAAHHRLVTDELDETGARDQLRASYRAFLAVNAELLSACTDWQLRTVGGEATLNDHTDAAYDGAIVARLREVHERIEPVCADLAAALDRFASYGPRLRNALERVEAGQAEWFTRPVMDSYHTVWFELHEDLLCTLGIERSKEEASL